MKRLRFKEISFLSYSQRKARVINLDSDVVLIKGDSDTGKSCITKSLYSVLGASIKSVPETWKNENIVVLMKFSIDDVNYKILHIGKDYFVYNPDGTQRTCASNLSTQSDCIFSLFDINLPKFEVNGLKQTLYMDYLFMPFYIDQDDGWGRPWTSFSKCGSSMLRSNFLLLHTGVVPEDYFLNKIQYDSAMKTIDRIQYDIAANERLCKSMKEKFGKIKLSLNDDDFKDEMDSFVQKITELKIAEKSKFSELKELYNKKSYLTFSIEQLHNNISEIDKDFKYALQQEDIITCPMCGAKVDNDFLGKLSMRDDIVKCKDLIIQYENELKDINAKIALIENSKQEISNKLIEISQLMQVKKDESSLSDYLDSKLNDYFDVVMKEGIDKLQMEASECRQIVEDLRTKIEGLSKSKRKQYIEEDFEGKVRSNLSMMNVKLNSEKKIRMSTNIAVTGTKVPRTIVAYTYAFIEIMQKYGGPVLCPIVVDEMRQRGLRDKDEASMFAFLINNKPKDSQLIIATASELFFNENTAIIELSDVNHLLNDEDFTSVNDEIDDLLYKNFNLRNEM